MRVLISATILLAFTSTLWAAEIGGFHDVPAYIPPPVVVAPLAPSLNDIPAIAGSPPPPAVAEPARDVRCHEHRETRCNGMDANGPRCWTEKTMICHSD
jgi:hypothetical protein